MGLWRLNGGRVLIRPIPQSELGENHAKDVNDRQRGGGLCGSETRREATNWTSSFGINPRCIHNAFINLMQDTVTTRQHYILN